MEVGVIGHCGDFVQLPVVRAHSHEPELVLNPILRTVGKIVMVMLRRLKIVTLRNVQVRTLSLLLTIVPFSLAQVNLLSLVLKNVILWPAKVSLLGPV